MNEPRLREILEEDGGGHTEKSIRSRISCAARAEEAVGVDLDYVVADDDRTYRALVKIRDSDISRADNLANALRWYYRAVNGKAFPRLAEYERRARPE
jgi:hypothetical protein